MDTPTRVPKRIGHYHVKRVIASGGMGTVYEATQEKPRRVVAIKLMKQGIASRSALRRFEYESQILARLHHPGIAQIYEAGTHRDDSGTVPFFAMEYIPNALPITKYAKEKKLGTRQKLELFAQVCDAIHHGHQKGIIHRDLKPSNILVDSHGQPRIIDFGVARGTDSDMAVTTLQTDIGQLIGTLQYMSPEQCLADPHDIDTRSDVYAMGVVLYELLSGRLPYTVSSTKIYDGARVIREEQPTKLTTIDKTLKDDIETIVFKALEKDRERRYQSAIEFAQDVNRYLSGEAIVARPPSIVYQLRLFARRNKALFGAIAAVFVVLLGGVIVSTSMYLRSEANRVKAESEANKSKATLEFLVTALRSGNPWVMGQPEPTIRSILDGATEELDGGALADQPEVEAAVRKAMSSTYSSLGLYDAALPHAQKELALHQEIHGPEHREALLAATIVGARLSKLDRLEEAEEILRTTLEKQRRILGPEDPDTVASMHRLAEILKLRNEYDEAERIQRQVLEICSRLNGDRHRRTLQAMAGLVLMICDSGRLAEAESLARTLLESRLQEFGEKNSSTLHAMVQLTDILTWSGRCDEAQPWIERRLRAFQEMLGDKHPQTGDAMMRAALNLSCQGKLIEAERVHRDSHQILSRVRGKENSWTLLAERGLGLLLIKRGKLDEAEALFRRNLEQSRDRAKIWSQVSLVRVLAIQGKLNEARPHAVDAIRRYERIAAQKYATSRDLTQYARTLLLNDVEDLRDPQTALRNAQRAVEYTKGGEFKPLGMLALAYFETGDTAKALETQERALVLLPPESYSRTDYEADLAKYLAAEGKLEEAQDHFVDVIEQRRRAVERPTPSYLELYDCARLLLTCEVENLRDPLAALPVAKRAVDMTGSKAVKPLDTLALAYFMTGDTAKAMETQEKAVSLLPSGDSPLRTELEANLAKYRHAAKN